MPFIADLNASGPVVQVVGCVGVIAAFLHVPPDPVKASWFSDWFLTMLVAKATAAFDMPVSEFACRYFCLFAAITGAQPQ